MHISKKCSVAIHCLLLIDQYGEERKLTNEMLSESTGCNAVVIRNLTSALKKNGILKSKPGGGMTIGRSRDEIDLYTVCKAVEPDFLDKLFGIHSAPSALCPVGKNIHAVLHTCYGKIRSDLVCDLQSVTLRSVSDEYRAAAQR